MEEVRELLKDILAELRAIRAALEPAAAEVRIVDPVAATTQANSIADLRAAGLWKSR